MTRPGHVTVHSIERYQQRVENLPDEQVCVRLSSPTIMAAVSFGTCSVRLPAGQRVVICDGRIVTGAPKPFRRKCRIGKS